MSVRNDKTQDKPDRHVNYVGLADAAIANLDELPEPLVWRSRLEEIQAKACKEWNQKPKGTE